MYLGKLSLFLRCLKCAQLHQNRLNSNWQESCDTVQKCLGLPRSRASVLVRTHNLSRVPKESLVESVELLNSFGYTSQEIAEHPVLLTRTSRKLHDHYLVLREVGFSSVTPIILVNFRKLIHKTVKTLKRLSFLPAECSVVNNLLLHLHPLPENFLFDFDDGDIVAQMHCRILKKYLQWRLEATSDEIETFFRLYRSLKFKSFQHLSENIDFALSIGFPPRKLLNFGYLLTTNPNYPKTILKEVQVMGNLDMRVAMRQYPRLVTISPTQFRTVYKILKEENVSDEIIQKAMNIFTLSPNTVKLRFEELKNIPELNILRHSPRMLRLIVHHNRARSRLAFLQELDMKCCSIALLEHDSEEYFDSRVKSGKDSHFYNEIVHLLSYLLKVNDHQIGDSLKKNPYHLHVPLLDIEKTVTFLQNKFSNSAILKVLPIVLYPSDKIDDALKQIDAIESMSPRRLSETKKLNMALYVMERSHHFTGNGVWAENS